MRSAQKLNLAEVIAIGIGGMIGGGIFAVLGLAIATAGHAVVPALAAGGLIALLTGFSYARLGVAFGGAGGSFTYIREGLAWPAMAGAAGWLLVAGYSGTLALYASAFGAYGASMLGFAQAPAARGALAALVLGGFLGINLLGAKLSGGVELALVAVKFLLLLLFVAAGLSTVHAAALVPSFDRGLYGTFAAMALIFVAYEGFELIPNAIDEMKNPQRNLLIAIVAAIVATILLYLAVAMVAFGNLTAAEIARDQEYVLAVAARPALGELGFLLIGVAALLSTASAINATLFGASRLAMVMARAGALPHLFARQRGRRAVPYASLIALTVLSLGFAMLANLSVISLFASATFLLIFAAVNFAGLRLALRLRHAPWAPLAGMALTVASFLLLIAHAWQNEPASLYWLAAFYGAAGVIQIVLNSRPRPVSPAAGGASAMTKASDDGNEMPPDRA